jgi:glycogen operon protein
MLGGSLAGINPLHHMFADDRRRVSPYQPSDRRFIDPIYIDLNEMQKRFGISAKKHEGEISRLRQASHVDYEAVWRIKDDVLNSVFEKFETSKDFEAFIIDGGAALRDHARFEARTDSRRYKYAQWLQWIADGQLAAAAKRAETVGLELGIYRDLALGCAYEGGEVWARPELFASSVSMGAPPDPFARDGQVWNLPPFNPLALAKADYEPFAEILRANMRHAKVLRIDHILGVARQFWVPRGASGADGAYVTMPMERLLAITAAESARAKCLVIGEDLGTVPEGLRDRLSQSNILSYRVLWFEQDEARFHSPASYPQGAAVCLSSHDLAPFKGWRENASDGDVAKLGNAIAEAGVNTGDFLADAHAFVAGTPCAVMLVQADDLSEESETLNVPGTDKERPNWRRRLSVAVEAIPDLATSKAVMAAIQNTGRGKNE